MRVLVTIPHFFRRAAPADGAAGFYGSETEQAAVRAAQVEGCVAALHQTFGTRQGLMGAVAEEGPANDALGAGLDIVLVTSGENHLVDLLPPGLVHHSPTGADPRCLGFLCHTLMRENAGLYDWFVFLEDDIAVTDPLFFRKLSWFGAQFGDRALLQPNRFELASRLNILKLYVDGNTTHPEVSARYQDISVRPVLEAEAFGQRLLFRRVDNVHSGCFFVTAAQLQLLLAERSFGQPTAEFFGPLESAATLPVMRAFETYKPARGNAGFLEVQHLGVRFLVPGGPPA